MNINTLSKQILSLRTSISYRSLAYFATAVTGFCALCSQVIWQRHLAILTGSEARSLSLVIAVFLLGLALGYYVFGLITEKSRLSRFLLLKYYGYIELLTGLYIGLFPLYFEFLKNLSFRSPNLLIIDICIAFLALVLPTFLMGASIPLLTAALPEDSKEINPIHAKVYGWNAFGAGWGALISGFYLIPKFGLNLSLHELGVLNVLASLVFIGNSLKGPVQKQKEPPSVPSPWPNSFFMLFVFLTGALVISLELLLIRILNVSLGAGVHNFPMILSLFVSALALGSLSIRKQKVSVNFFIRQLFIVLLFLQFLFWTAPYWSIWFNHIRISLSSIPPNYFIYHLLIFLLLSLFLSPAVFFMGRLLPLTYMFLKKTKDNYGKVCGFLYFFNTLGTVFGAVVIGYLAFYLFNLDILFKASIYILFLLTLGLILYKKNILNFVILSVLGLTLLILPTQWNRSGHEVGYFRTNKYEEKMHFKGLFFLPKRIKESKVGFLEDGPNSTVSLLHYSILHPMKTLKDLNHIFSTNYEKIFPSYSIIVNGKSDGNSLGDFSTMFFMLPYFYAPQKSKLETAFIGLGTGISAGSYTPLEDVKGIDVLEISPFVTRAVQTVTPELNFQVTKNRKVKIIETDAFKHFTRNRKKYDIIISEPTNPWVVGVENLFTVEFYKLVSQSLNKGGIFGQWIQVYDMDLYTLRIMINTIHQVFPYAHLYKIGHKDTLVVASSTKLKTLSKKRFEEPFIKKFYKAMGFEKLEDIYLSQILNMKKFHQTARLSQIQANSLIQPRLIYRTNKAKFLGFQADPFSLINKFHPHQKKKTQKMKVFDKHKETIWKDKCVHLMGFNFLCSDMYSYNKNWQIFKDKEESFIKRFVSYIFLRNRGLIPYNKDIMDLFFNESIKQKKINLNILSDYVSEKIQIRDYKGANKDAMAFKNKKLINEQHYQNFKNDMGNVKKAHELLLSNRP